MRSWKLVRAAPSARQYGRTDGGGRAVSCWCGQDQQLLRSLRHRHDLNHITENSAWLLDDTAFLVGGLLRIRWLVNQGVSRRGRAFSCSSAFFQRSSLTFSPIENPDDRRGGIHRHPHGQALVRKILMPSGSST